jgi:hypothetical protein
MKRSFRLSFFTVAVAIGGTAFGLLWLPKAQAAYCSTIVNTAADMCYGGVTQSVPYIAQPGMLAKGATCGPCKVSGT